jgi:hypothetical protein
MTEATGATEPWLALGRMSRRRILLQPIRPILSPAGLSPRSGSRFDPLEDSEVDEEITVAEEVAWDGLEDEPKVLPIAHDGELDRAALLEDFWGKIGFPGAAARPWERRVSSSALVEPRARSESPPRVEPARLGRAISSSPPGLRLPRQPVRIKGWKGPLPSKRITPLAVFGDFLNIAKTGADRAAGGSSSPVHEAVTSIRPRFEPEEAGSSLAGPQSRWAGLCRAFMGLQREDRRRVHQAAIARHAIVRSYSSEGHAVAASHPSAPLHVPPDPRTCLSSLSTPLSGAPFRWSFVDVVARGASVGAMAGPSRPVPPGTSPAPSAPPPARAVDAPGNGAYQGPMGFQGWPAGALMPPAPAAPPRPQVGYRPPPPRMPAAQFMPQQQPPYPPQQQYPQYQGQFF